MCYVARKVSGFPDKRVMGMAGILDNARYRCFIAMELKVAVDEIQAMVLGGHGDDMVPVVSATNVSGVPLTSLLSKKRLSALVERTRKGGGEIVALLEDRLRLLCPGRGRGADGRGHPQEPAAPGAGIGLSHRGIRLA